MSWQDTALPMLRALIFDLDCTDYAYSDNRLLDVLIVAAYMIESEIDFVTAYTINISGGSITPDPEEDTEFIYFLTLKASCMIDMGNARLAAMMDHINAKCGPVSMSVSGRMGAFALLIDKGYCATYADAVLQHSFGNGNYIRSIMSPFTNSTFDPTLYNNKSASYDRELNL